MRRKTDMNEGPHESPELRRRLILALSIPMIVIMSVSSLLDYRLARKTSDLAHDQALTDTVLDLENHIEKKKATSTLDLSAESEAILRSSVPDTVYFSIRDKAGRLLSGDLDVPMYSMPESSVVSYRDGRYQGKDVRVALHRVHLPESEIFITVMETTDKRKQSRQQILTAMLLPNLAVIVATLLAVWFGVRQGLLPLGAVETEIATRSPNDLREIDIDTAPRETHPMLHRLNELFALLREASDAQNRFIADAAHQLRTPLAGLQTQLDLAVNEGVFARNEGRLQNIEELTERLRRLLGQLLSYARTESSGALIEKQEYVSLDQIVEKSASIFLDAALKNDVDFGFDILPATVYGVPWLLQEALANLIDNAIRYVPKGGVVTVRCGKNSKMAFLEVEDNGPGIEKEYLGHVLERFYRIPGSPSNGCGLGLPIVKEIAELHGAELRLIPGKGSGLCVRLEFSSHAAVGFSESESEK